MAWKLIGAAALLVLAGCGVALDQRANSVEATSEARWPPVGAFVTVDGARVHYLQKGRGPDVVLLHGASGNLRDFSFDLLDRLVAANFRVTAFDRPGLGYTDRPSSQYGGALNTSAESPQVQAAFLAKAADQLGIRRPIVVGHSYGGAVAMAWGLDQDASALVTLGGAIMPWPGGLGARYDILGSAIGGAVVPPFVTAFTDPMSTDTAVAAIFRPNAVPEGYLEHVGPGLSLRRETIRANGRQVQSLRPSVVKMSARYPQLSLPVELVHGDADTTVGLEIHARAADAILPNSRLTVLAGVGHMPQHARPGAVVEAVRRAAERGGLR